MTKSKKKKSNIEKNQVYWQDRASKETWNLYNTLEEKNKELIKFYDAATKDIQRELVDTLLKINPETPSLSEMYKFQRLTKLEANMQKTIESLYKKVGNHTNNQLLDAINGEYEILGKLFELDFAVPNKKLIEMLLQNPWSGEVFSDTLWEDKRALIRNLNKTLVRGLVQGTSIRNISLELATKLKTSYKKTYDLVRNETMHFLNESAKERYKDADIEYIQVIAAEDERMCDECGGEHLKKYKIDEAPIFPLHYKCRCTIVPVIE